MGLPSLRSTVACLKCGILGPDALTRGCIFICVCVCARAKSLQSCLTLCNTMDCSLPGSSVHGDSPGKNTGVGCNFLLQGTFLTQESNLCRLCFMHWQAASLPLMPHGKPRIYIYMHMFVYLFLAAVGFILAACRIFHCDAQVP